ncbi:translocation/assembly module TamB [Marinilabilia rubra]|uniref:Translocation/assembly module TamB n=2 Tax=Marinilabilia rubra TaxID=2162893 RepID=A0A2U2B633_9BACT|nr:translocation/assembly module TamB [Marinilabilia rubra]
MLPGIQTHIVHKLTERLSKDFNTEISIGRVQALPFSGIDIKEFLVRDLNNDTLLFSPTVHSEIDYFSFFKRHFYIGRVTMENPKVKLLEYEDGMNFSFLIDSIGNNKSDTSKWHYSVRGFEIKNGQLILKNSILKNSSFKRDSLAFSELNLSISRTSGVNDSLDFHVNQLSLKEQSGLTIKSAGTKGKIRREKISINDFFIRTDASEISINQLDIPVNPREKGNDPERRFKASIEQILIAPREAALLFHNIPKLDKPLGLSGDISGSLKNLKGRDILISLGRYTRMRTSFDLTDLSDFKEMFIFMKVEKLQTTATDIQRILGENNENGAPLPDAIKKLGIIHYSGNLTGFTSDLVAFGDFNTELGILKTDLGMKYSERNGFSFSGTLNTQNFQLGEAFPEENNTGHLTMNVQVKGQWKTETNYSAHLDGKIRELEWKKHLYQDIDLNGLFTHQKFDGSVDIKDPYGTLRFDGEVDASGKKPVFKFTADLENIMPDRLNLIPKLKDGVITMSLGANFEGSNLDNLSGDIGIHDGLIFTPQTSLTIDTLSLKAFEEGDAKKIILNSDFIEGEIKGQYNFNKFRQSFLDMVAHFLPSLAHQRPGKKLPVNQFNFNFSFKGFDRALKIIYPDLRMAYNGHLKGQIDSEKQIVDIKAEFDSISYKNISARDIEFHANTKSGSDMNIIARAGKIDRANTMSLYNFSVHQKAGRDTLNMNVFWNNWGSVTNSGALYTSTAFRREKGDKFYSSTHLLPSTVILQDSIWEISEAKALFTPSSFSIQGLEISNKQQRLAVNGFLHRESMDGIRLEMDNIDLAQFFGKESESRHQIGGIADGSIELKDYYRTPLWSANFSVDQFSFDGDTAGFFTLGSRWDTKKEALAVNTSLMDGNHKPLEGNGYIDPLQNNVDLELNLDSFNISFLDTFIGHILQDFDASTSGKLYITGSLDQPHLTGKVNVDQGRFDVDLLQTSYEITDSVWFYPYEIRFKDLTIKDRHNKTGTFRGSIFHEGFANMVYNLQLDVKEMLVLDTRQKDNPFYYGTVYGNGEMGITGVAKNVELNISGETLNSTRFFIPMEDTEEAVQSNFIRFTSKDTGNPLFNSNEAEKDNEYKVDLSGLELNMEIDVTPQAKIEIIFDSALGDLLSATGGGNIQIQIDRQGNISFFGDYIIDRGEYLFSLQNLVNKKFDINKGGTVSWQGDPYKARIDLTAVYKLKASLADLVGPMAEYNSMGGQNDIQRRIPINCNLMLNGPLEKPGIRFGIEAPTLTESRESYMLDFISSEDEMNRQVLSLLVLNRFYTPDYLRMGGDQGMQTNNAALVTTTEMLSNQLSRWLSNISSDVDVGVSYRPEDNISSEEIEVALSTQMFNNRVTINGNVGYGKYQTNTSKMVGDFDMDVKLNPSGTIRAKAYTRSNDDIIYETSPTTQGIGISFKEEFDKITDLFKKYWMAITGKKKSDQ